MALKRTSIGLVVVALTTALVLTVSMFAAGRSGDYTWFDPILDVRQLLVQNYVDPLDNQAMQTAMIHGMIETLDDPFTEYVPPSDEAEFNKELRGTYVGIGAEVQILNDYLTIVSPLPGSPALESGIMAGDTVTEIEGKSTFKVSINDCINRLIGEPGSKVTITVRHVDGVEQTLTLTRRQIITQTVKGLRRDGAQWKYCVNDALGIAYVHITQFNDSTANEFRAAIRSLGPGKVKGLVLDLRDNPGGGLPTAIEMADMFLDKGVIVSVRGRAGDERSWSADPKQELAGVPMVVIVNQQSASASEILSGALHDNGRAKVLGMRTYGKGSVQEVRELSDHRGTLKLTVAHYFLASGRNIHRKKDSTEWGVDPDPGFVVRVTDDAYRKTLKAHRDFEIVRTPGQAGGMAKDEQQPDCSDADWIRARLLDEQLALAVETMQAKLRTGEWAVVGEQDSEIAAREQERQRLAAARVRIMDQLGEVEQRLTKIDMPGPLDEPALLPTGVDLVAGTITLKDKNQHVIGTFRIDGGDPEAALRRLELSRIESN